MLRTHRFVCGAALMVVALVAACTKSKEVSTQVAVNPLFQTYVALGNSLTAGFQSGGINDSTQRQGYAALFAQAANTRFALPLLNKPGCPPPVDNFLTQHRVGGGSATDCFLRANTAGFVNDLAVPGAATIDPVSLTTVNSNALTQFILGGQSQVFRASQLHPTFVSMWIGNNDALGAAASGLLTKTIIPGNPPDTISLGLTDTIVFVKNYKADIGALTALSSVKGGVLFAVVDVTNAALMFHSNLLFTAYKAEFDAFAGQVTAVDPSCMSNVALISFQMAGAIRAGQHPPAITCQPGLPGLAGIFVLDSVEVGTVQQYVATYNRYIQAKADSIGWAYVDINPILVQLKASGAIPIFPYPVPDTAFGTYVSLDGIHPTIKAHTLIANEMIDSVNAKYGSSIPAIP